MEEKHNCFFKEVAKYKFQCTICNVIHMCGPVCDSLNYNKDYTNVCLKTGVCFEQKRCDEIYDKNRNTQNTFELTTGKVNKISQVYSMRSLSIEFIESTLKTLKEYIPLSDSQMNALTEQIYTLWLDVVKAKVSLRRKDRRCVIVAIVFNMYKGIETSTGIVVHKHPFLEQPTFNKRIKDRMFDVSDVRTGQLFIRNVYARRMCPCPININ